MILQKDIAKKLGISRSSVAVILSGKGDRYSPEMRRKVLEASREMGYRRNVAAATMRLGVNNSTVAFVGKPEEAGRQSLSFMIVQALNRLGFGIRLYDDRNVKETFEDILCNQLNKVINASLCSEFRRKSTEICRKNNVRMAFLGTEGFPDFPVFKTDQKAAMKQAVFHLYELGHRRIGLHCGPRRQVTTKERHQGFLEGLAECGLESDSSWCICKEFDERILFHFLRTKRPTALCCLDSGLSFKTEIALLKAGIRVPEDISLVNFGNQDKFATEYSCVPLDCLLESTEEIIRSMVDWLVERDLGICPNANGEYLFKTAFQRASSSAAPNPDTEYFLASAKPAKDWKILEHKSTEVFLKRMKKNS